MIKIFRWILLPISIIYALIVWIRNKMYDYGLLTSQSFDIPTIVVGNLAIGGAGKSPMTEYIIAKLKDSYKIATLSRGYGRKTKGFKFVQENSTVLEVGDEPLQFKRKFKDITVAVCENRCHGIEILKPNVDLIILDDAYQHRKLKADLYLLLFDFNSLFQPLITLPTGNFRDNFSSIKRANYIIITKCPKIISSHQKDTIERHIRKYTHAPIFYSSILYNNPICFHDRCKKIDDLKAYEILLFCGIANPKPLYDYLTLDNNVKLISFPDHHNYSQSDYEKIINAFNRLTSTKKIILTTEKDKQRINSDYFDSYPLYYIPINTLIESSNELEFTSHIKDYIKTKIS